MSSSFRLSVERVSVPTLQRLATLPRLVPFVAVLALFVAGILIPHWGWVLLAVVTLLLAWVLYLSWPTLPRIERLMRFAVLSLALAITIVKAVPRG